MGQDCVTAAQAMASLGSESGPVVASLQSEANPVAGVKIDELVAAGNEGSASVVVVRTSVTPLKIWPYTGRSPH